jgi:hypothetical protein
MPSGLRELVGRVARLSDRWIFASPAIGLGQGLGLFASGLSHALAGQCDPMGVVNEAIKNGGGVRGIADDLAPAPRAMARSAKHDVFGSGPKPVARWEARTRLEIGSPKSVARRLKRWESDVLLRRSKDGEKLEDSGSITTSSANPTGGQKRG